MSFERMVMEDHPGEATLERDLDKDREDICDSSLGEHSDGGASSYERCLLANLMESTKTKMAGEWSKERVRERERERERESKTP